MVVLAPGAVIQAEDIPLDVRETSGRSLLPVQAGDLAPTDVAEGVAIPQMEFLFRTLVDMKIDLEDLRSEFDRFRTRYTAGGAPVWEDGTEPVVAPEPLYAGIAAIEVSGSRDDEVDGSAAIQVEPEMTMADIERQAIVLALEAVGGNRRKAAERLGIGERTLYRKIKEYDLDGGRSD